MKNYFLHKIVYSLHRVGFCYYSIKYYIEDNYSHGRNLMINFINYIVILFKAILFGLKIFNYNFGHYEYLEIPITTKCSLRCKGCSNLIPCYKNPSDVELKKLLKSIEVFLECINNIVYIRVLGGEPFVSKNLFAVIQKLLNSDKIQRIEVVTNGTIIPRDKQLLKILSNKKIIVCISKYPKVNIDKIVNVLIENSIKYKIDDMNFWMDYGDLNKRNKSIKELEKQYRKCNHVCKSLLNGELHLCPRSSHGTDLGVIKNNKDDYVYLLDKSLNTVQRRKKINKLLKRKFIWACDYCDFATHKSKKIKVAEQLSNRN